MRISVVIPAYNDWRLTRRCIAALRAATPAELIAEIVVVDDASTDAETVAWTRAQSGIVAVLLEQNHGFSGACNAGAARCTGEAIFFLNTDAFATPGALPKLAAALDADPAVGIVGARLLYSDGTLQHAGLALLSGPASRWWHVHKRRDGLLPDACVPRDFLAVTGAALLIRRGLFAQLGGFAPDYVNGWEDVDLCLRAWLAGARVRYEPSAVLEHLESATVGRNKNHEANERRFVARWEAQLVHAPRYPLPEVPPIAFAAGAAALDDGWAREHIMRWWKSHLGASIVRTRPGSRIDRARVDTLAGLARRLPSLEVAWNEAVLAPPTGTYRVGYAAPRDDAEARAYAAARGVAHWWAPTSVAGDALRAAGVPAERITIVRLGAQTLAPTPASGAPVIAAPAVDAAILERLAREHPGAQTRVLAAGIAPDLHGVDIVVAGGGGDRFGLLLPAALGNGCAVVTSPPVDALLQHAPGVTVVAAADLYAAAAADVENVERVRAGALERFLDARRRFDAYLATQHVAETARATTGGSPSSALVAIDPARTVRGLGATDGTPTICAHLIFGKNEEAFLPALLASLEGVVERIIVNDNSGEPDGPNARAVAASSFARSGRVIYDREPFVDFSHARNRVLALHREHDCGEWAAFVDADEVHRPIARTIARNLQHVPSDVAIVDGYTRHYFQSFRLYTSIERRMTFFRVTPNIVWTGRVHERLIGHHGRHLAIPYVYDHYGAVSSRYRQAAKGRQYSSLGQSGRTVTDAELASIDDRQYFTRLWPLALRYHGEHPEAVAGVRAAFEARDGERLARSEAYAAEFQTPRRRLINVARRVNFEYRWRGRALDPLALRLLAPARRVAAQAADYVSATK